MAQAKAGGALNDLNTEIVASLDDFQDPSQEWRRLFSELLGTFFLVLVAAGGGMMGQAFPGTISRAAAVAAPGLMVMAVILFMGKVSGAHLNPAVTIAFSLRGDFPWRRVPGYIVAQLIGATLAALFLHAVINVSASYGSNYPASGYSASDAFMMEAVLTLGLVSVILGTASGAQNIGIIGAIGVGAYIALAGLWGSPISGASMNPARTFGPNLVATDFTSYWVYVAGPLVGAVLAVGAAWVLRGAGGVTGLRGIGVQSATVLVREAFVRHFANGKALGSYAGLASSPYSSGGIDREQGIGKAGNRRVRTVMVELAWLWTRYQPDAAQVCWFRERVGSTGPRVRKIMVVALARKLLIALWRFVIDGVVPEGAVLKPVA